MTIRVLIADDHPLVRDGLKAALAALPDVQVVAEAATGTAAVREALLHRPDVVVMDLQMPELNGVEATRQLGRALPSAAVLVLTMFDDDDSVFAAMRAGARGYVKAPSSTRSPGRSPRSPPGRPSSGPRSPPGCWPTSPPHPVLPAPSRS
jgi:DNA-binding NarL/FixJ family response regulator